MPGSQGQKKSKGLWTITQSKFPRLTAARADALQARESRSAILGNENERARFGNLCLGMKGNVTVLIEAPNSGLNLPWPPMTVISCLARESSLAKFHTTVSTPPNEVVAVSSKNAIFNAVGTFLRFDQLRSSVSDGFASCRAGEANPADSH